MSPLDAGFLLVRHLVLDTQCSRVCLFFGLFFFAIKIIFSEAPSSALIGDETTPMHMFSALFAPSLASFNIVN